MTAVTEKEITVSQLLILAKKRVQFTVASLASHTGASEATVDTWLAGRYLPTRRYHKAICEHTRTHGSRFERIYSRQLEERRDANRMDRMEMPIVQVVKQEAKPVDKVEHEETKWAVELAFEVSRLDKEVYEMFMNVLKNINKEKGIQR